ncbi:MAG TPA: hypothetical protein VFG68_21000 [Fimbriiglobus sp.]|nr:hypothetical protein [Fimbriiglobus sp.]
MPQTARRPLRLERLEDRAAPAVLAALTAGTLTVTTDDADQRLAIDLDPLTGQVVVRDSGLEVGRFAGMTRLVVASGAGNDRIEVAPAVTQPAEIDAGDGRNVVRAGGGPTTITGGDGVDKFAAGPAGAILQSGGGTDRLVGGSGPDTFDGGAGPDRLIHVEPIDAVVPDLEDLIAPLPDLLAGPAVTVTAQATLSADEVRILLDRATAATASRDAIIAVVDRNGRILGVRVEDQVSAAITADTATLVFAVDGAVAKARTGAFFGNNQAPLTSRTIQFISQSTITEREVNSNPNVTDPNSPLRGPGFVAAVGLGGHFPPGIANTPPVDLFAIEHTNRDSTAHPGPDRIKGTADDVTLPSRFNIDPAFVPPGQALFPPDSYGVTSGVLPTAQSRGIATLPGGIPIFKNGQVVGGIGVFFPGRTGFATEENSSASTTFDRTKPDRTLEAEVIAFAAVGGSSGAGFPIGQFGDAPALPAGFDLPFARIDLVGITLDVFGPGGVQGPENLVEYALARFQVGSRTQGVDLPVGAGGELARAGLPVPEGWLVVPHDGVGITAAEVRDIILRGFTQATRTRAAIREIGSFARMVFAVTDLNGNVVGLYRMPDATVFSIDVAVAKARNVAYYADAARLQPIDQVPGVPPGTAFTNRTFRYLAQPRFPEGIDGKPPGPFSILLDGNADPITGRLNGAPLPASAFQSVYGYDSFNPQTNFRDPANVLNQNGIVFFPGSAPLYRSGRTGAPPARIGGFGVSGDGVDQDDVVTFAGSTNFGVPLSLLRADQVSVAGVRLPYQKFNRNPEGGIPH